MKYRIYFDRISKSSETLMTEEFEAENDEAAKKVYEDFCKARKEARESRRYYADDYPERLVCVVQEEILRQLS